MILNDANIKKQSIDSEILNAKTKYELALEGYEIAKAAELKKQVSELMYEAEKQAKIASDIKC